MRASSLYEIIREQTIKTRYPELKVSNLSWRLNPLLLSKTKVYWPSKYSWNYAGKWLDHIKNGFSQHVRIETRDDLPEFGGNHIVYIILKLDNKEHLVSIDYSDCSDIHEDSAKNSLCYFKMQYKKIGYNFENVVPGGFIPNSECAYKYTSRLNVIPLAYSYHLYGRFGLNFATDIRTKALKLLNEQNIFKFEGSGRKIRYSRFLEEAYFSRLVLDLPGNGDLCFRLIDYLAIGCAIISPEHKNILPVPLEDGKNIIYCKEDLSDLVQKCESTINNPKLLLKLRENSREYFNKYLHKTQLTAFYLNNCFKRV